MIIFDFDGTIIPSRKVEKLCRRVFEGLGLSHPPRIFFALGEVIDFFRFFFSRETKKVAANDHIMKIISDKSFTSVGILTDRSWWSLCQFFKIMDIDADSLNFIQTKKSFLDLLSPRKKNILRSKSIKPDKGVYTNLIFFIDNLEIKKNEVLIVDDSFQARKAAQEFGFHTLDPKMIKPESS